MVGHARRKELAEGLRGVFAAPSSEVALRLASELAAHWRQSHPRVAEHLEEHIVRSASHAWPSLSLTAGASALPTLWSVSTRR